VSAQNSKDSATPNIPLIYGARLRIFLDSIKSKILADTAKFNAKDLVFSSNGRQNSKPYSKLYIVNGCYIYKLDIINNSEVIQFVKEILDYTKIKSIAYVDSSIASSHFGENTWHGIFYITMFDKAKFNPKVAGLALVKNKSGDNFRLRNKDEILIHE
jgi:hypothetical protein